MDEKDKIRLLEIDREINELESKNIIYSKRIQEIADRTANMAWAQKANSRNPEFVDLMNEQIEKCGQSERAISAILELYSERSNLDPNREVVPDYHK